MLRMPKITPDRPSAERQMAIKLAMTAEARPLILDTLISFSHVGTITVRAVDLRTEIPNILKAEKKEGEEPPEEIFSMALDLLVEMGRVTRVPRPTTDGGTENWYERVQR